MSVIAPLFRNNVLGSLFRNVHLCVFRFKNGISLLLVDNIFFTRVPTDVLGIWVGKIVNKKLRANT